MKANELMIGDWVLSKSDDKKYKINSIITQDDGTILLATEDGLRFDYMYEPIPLTAEILEKNGFKKRCSKYTWEYKFSDKSSLVIISLVELGKEGEVFVFNKETEKHMKLYFRNRSFSSFCYLHELQHALRLCGLAELVDNFKI